MSDARWCDICWSRDHSFIECPEYAEHRAETAADVPAAERELDPVLSSSPAADRRARAARADTDDE
jgi:hypothetical protein